MMKDTLLRPGQVSTISTNLDLIEAYLGSPIPGGMIDAYDLADHVFTAGEVTTICSNIKMVTNYHRPSKRSTLALAAAGILGISEVLIVSILMFGGALAVLYDFFFPVFVGIMSVLGGGILLLVGLIIRGLLKK